MKFLRDARTVGRFGRWAILTAVAFFVSAVTFGEKILVGWKWLIGAPK
ncbi:hypothetical protein [Enterovirga sp. CN4-39]